ncbi:MAG: Gmad2 immunoglobulin-like domain-containing protein [Bacillota bacterium]
MKRGALALILVMVLLVTAGCSKPKDILSLAGLNSLAGLTVVDRTNKTTPVADLTAFTEAFKQATLDPKGKDLNLALVSADYQLIAGGKKFYYFLDKVTGVRGHLVFVDAKNRQHVYFAELDRVIAQLFASAQPPAPGTPDVKVKTGAPTDEIASWARSLAEVKTPVAYLMEHGDETVMIFAAGERPGATYTVEVDEVTRPAKVFVVNFKVQGPSNPASSAVSYPYTVITFDSKVDAVARTIEGTQVKEWPVIRMAADQSVVLLQPRAGSLLTERVTLVGKARVTGGDLSVEIEDGHYVLGHASFRASRVAPSWGDFEVRLDLKSPTNMSGSIIFFTGSSQLGNRQELLVVPIVFAGGK